MKSALLALAFYGMIYVGCCWHGARERFEHEAMRRNNWWVETSAATMPQPCENVESFDLARYPGDVKIQYSRQL